jgi:hypothetical protein
VVLPEKAQTSYLLSLPTFQVAENIFSLGMNHAIYLPSTHGRKFSPGKIDAEYSVFLALDCL